MSIKASFGDRFDELLVENNISPEVIAKETNISLPMIYKYLAKDFIPSTMNAIVIADYFNCSLDYLFGLNNDITKQTFKQSKNFSAIFIETLKKHNCTRYKIRKETNLPKQSIDDWYHDKRIPTIESLITLAKYFDCSIDYLVGRTD